MHETSLWSSLYPSLPVSPNAANAVIGNSKAGTEHSVGPKCKQVHVESLHNTPQYSAMSKHYIYRLCSSSVKYST